MKSISKTLFDFPWITPEDFPDYSIVMPSSEVGNLIGSHTKNISDKRRVFFFSTDCSESLTLEVEIPKEWKKENLSIDYTSEFGCLSTWAPGEYLVTGMSSQAVERAKVWREKEDLIEVKAFDGSPCKGIDLKKLILPVVGGREIIRKENL